MTNTNKLFPCRFCGSPVIKTFADLGLSPLCETYIAPDQLNDMEPFYPLHALICDHCLLVQLDEYVSPSGIFEEYAYFSSYSDSWLKHASDYSDMVVERFGLDGASFVVELASNDGYLLRNFVEKGIPCQGIEPAVNVAEAATELGIDTLIKFFGQKTADEVVRSRGHANLIIGNNVLAHVPDLNDFVSGIRTLLAKDGVVTMEFPHLLRLMDDSQFDTIYHEHFSYFSYIAVDRVFRAHGMVIFDVDQLSTHGGSLRIYAKHDVEAPEITKNIRFLANQETEAGLDKIDTYLDFQDKVNIIKRDLLEFLIVARRKGKTVVGYGAPGKGNTLLNYCGIGTDFLDYTVDRNPYKHGKYTPGSRIPILSPDRIRATKPDYLLILPWNLRKEIVDSHSYIGEWGGQFVVPIPHLETIAP